MVLVLVLPFRHWPAVLEAVREIRDDLGDRTQCLLVGDEDLGRAFEGGLYISSEAVTIDWGLLPLQRGDSLGDLWAETFWAAPLDPGPDD